MVMSIKPTPITAIKPKSVLKKPNTDDANANSSELGT